MPAETIIVVIPCHFKRKNELCATSIKRLERALNFYSRALFILTGPVPFESGSKTLSDLMREYLISEGVPKSRIFGGEGVEIFSEAKNTVALIERRFPDCKAFEIVSSDWYFLPGWKIWSHAASESGLEIETIEVFDTGASKREHTICSAASWFGYPSSSV